jgi:hypothetical protein
VCQGDEKLMVQLGSAGGFSAKTGYCVHVPTVEQLDVAARRRTHRRAPLDYVRRVARGSGVHTGPAARWLIL